MSSTESLLHNAALLAAARIGVLGAQPLSEEMLSQCVLEAYWMDHLRNKLASGIGVEGVLADRLAKIEPKVSAEALAVRLGQSMPAPGVATPETPAARF